MTGSYEAEDVLHASLVYVYNDEIPEVSVVGSGGIDLASLQTFGYILDFRLTDALAEQEENVAIQCSIFIDPEWVAVPCCVFHPDPNDPALRRVQPLYYDGTDLPADNIVQVHLQFYQFNR